MSQNATTSCRVQAGLSLVELLVAITISLILATGVIQIFLGSKSGYTTQEGLSRLQENGRFAVTFLSDEIREAGFAGCSPAGLQRASLIYGGRNFQTTLAGGVYPPAASTIDSLLQAIQGWEAAGTGDGAAITVPDNSSVAGSNGGTWATTGGQTIPNFNAVASSDILQLWGDGGGGVTIYDVSPGANTVVNIDRDNDIQDDEILLFTDCANAVWGQACNVQDVSAGVDSTNLTLSAGCVPGNDVTAEFDVNPGGTVLRGFSQSIYFVGKRADNPNNPPALFRVQIRPNGTVSAVQELVEGVESMQVLYGISGGANRQATQYVAASLVPNWENVISARIALLVRSEDVVEPGAPAQQFNVNGTTVTAPADGRMRQVFTTTVTLRNRAL